ncbi:MAG: hypothetical protein EOP68_19930 [Sphingomonas sp.]|nr:MAG: hypothetical protein EOP68_19930 [Sphingomonas sp.]
MTSATLLTPNAVKRRQAYVDWAEQAERDQRSRARRRRALVVGVPAALLAAAGALTLSGAPQRLLAPATEVSLSAPVAAPRPSAMSAQVVAAPAALREVAAPTPVRTALRVDATPPRHRAFGRSGSPLINDAPDSDRQNPGGGSQGGLNGTGTTSPRAARAEGDRLAALDAIRELRLR